MKIMVCLKQVPHQDARLDIDADGSWIQEDNIKFEINSYDTYALEEALRVKDATRGRGLVVSIGPERVTQALRTALGMGADRAIHVKDRRGRGLRPARRREDPRGDREGREARSGLHRPHVRRRQLRRGAADAGRAGRAFPSATGAVAVERKNGTFTRRARDRGRRAARSSSSRRPACRGADRHQPGPLRVAQGHHGGEEEAARREDRRRSRRRGSGGRGRGEDQDREDRAAPEGRPALRSCPDRPTRVVAGLVEQDQGARAPLSPAATGTRRSRWAAFSIVAEIQGGKIREASYELAAFAQKLAGAGGRASRAS